MGRWLDVGGQAMTLLAEMHKERVARLHRLGMFPSKPKSVAAPPQPELLPRPDPPAPDVTIARSSLNIDKWTMCDIVSRTVALRWRVSSFDLRGTSRSQRFLWPRHIAIYLTRKITGKSMPHIGRFFEKDHTTILHSLRKVSNRRETNTDLNNELNYLEQLIITGKPVTIRSKSARANEFEAVL